MDHESAVHRQSAERYALGEMETGERDAFEEHFFSCQLCAGEVRAVSAFIDNARDIFRNEAGGSPRVRDDLRRFGWFSFLKPSLVYGAVAVCALAVVTYQSLVTLPQLRAPRAFRTTVLKGEARGTDPVIQVRPGEPLVLKMDVNSGESAREYTLEIQSPAGATNQKVSAEDRQVNLFIPATAVRPGVYTIAVRDANNPHGPELGRYRFEVHVP